MMRPEKWSNRQWSYYLLSTLAACLILFGGSQCTEDVDLGKRGTDKADPGIDGGAADMKNPPADSSKECNPPLCNWCGGENILDGDGCIVGYRCANGADPCATNPCSAADPNSCQKGEVCQPDQLCWPFLPEGCSPPLCNWCGGENIFDAEGCIVGYSCANGADPCATNPCSAADPASCAQGEKCGADGLCW